MSLWMDKAERILPNFEESKSRSAEEVMMKKRQDMLGTTNVSKLYTEVPPDWIMSYLQIQHKVLLEMV